MSAAIMHNTASLYDFGDYLFKNQTSSRTNVISPNNNNINTTTVINNNNNNASPPPNSNSQIFSNILGTSMQTLLTNGATTPPSPSTAPISNNNNNNNNLFNQQSSTAAVNPVLLQQHINVVVAQQQHDHHKKIWFHNPLTRTVSHPQNDNVVTLMSSLIENLNGQQNGLIDNLSTSPTNATTPLALATTTTVIGHRKLERTQSEPLPQANTSRYKTELCRSFEEAGGCKYGEKCQFAHGVHELRNLQRHPKYKTEKFRTYHSTAFCPYGPRCHFIHEGEDVRPQQGYNRLTSAAASIAFAAVAQAIQQQAPLPLSPPLSMSTGSDRASPTGSLSMSPTSSMAAFPFNEQMSPANSVFQAFTFNTPPASPQSEMSASPPPPTIMSSNTAAVVAAAQILSAQQQYITQTQINKHSVIAPPSQAQNTHTKQHNNGVTMVSAVAQPAPGVIGGGKNTTQPMEDTRLPVFNRLSSTVDAFTNLTI